MHVLRHCEALARTRVLVLRVEQPTSYSCITEPLSKTISLVKKAKGTPSRVIGKGRREWQQYNNSGDVAVKEVCKIITTLV